MAKQTLEEIKNIEQDIYVALQVLWNEINTLIIIKNSVEAKRVSNMEVSTVFREEIKESLSSIEELLALHKNLESQLSKLEDLTQDLNVEKV